jgi:predicted nuclease of restriction endonuclease-like (RecB) superfamily
LSPKGEDRNATEDGLLFEAKTDRGKVTESSVKGRLKQIMHDMDAAAASGNWPNDMPCRCPSSRAESGARCLGGSKAGNDGLPFMSKAKKPTLKASRLTFENLVLSIRGVDEDLAAQAGRAVNFSLTLRNWLIGCYIAEYELRGADRAQYGEKLLAKLSIRLMRLGVSRAEERELRRYRQFYQTYPQIRESLTPELTKHLVSPATSPSAPIRESVTPESSISGKELVTKLSFSHIAELIAIAETLKRSFYETECIRGNWGVRELKRQIASLYFERSGLSRDKAKLAKLAQTGVEPAQPRLPIRDPYIFEFLGLKPREVMSETHLEDQLLDKLQEFLLELGHGFCFEARQKRILIGNTLGFVDLVFYHRILKCHVLIELKLETFSHQNIGQLNTYVTWFAKNMMAENDNPPIGILLCTQKDHALAEYALAGMDNQLFVSKYQLHLPEREQLQRELERTLKEGS